MVFANVVRTQGIYFIATGVAPLLSLEAFERVTGPKTDDWLVLLVGLLAISVGMSLLACARLKEPRLALLLGLSSALSFAIIDLLFAWRFSVAYVVDAAIELGLCVALIATALHRARAVRAA